MTAPSFTLRGTDSNMITTVADALRLIKRHSRDCSTVRAQDAGFDLGRSVTIL